MLEGEELFENAKETAYRVCRVQGVQGTGCGYARERVRMVLSLPRSLARSLSLSLPLFLSFSLSLSLSLSLSPLSLIHI